MRRASAGILFVIGTALAMTALPFLGAAGVVAFHLWSALAVGPFEAEEIVLTGHYFSIGGRYLTARQFFALMLGLPAILITIGVGAILLGVSLWRRAGRDSRRFA